MLTVAAKLLQALFLWSVESYAHEKWTRSRDSIHPWMLVITGAHGSGKSALTSHILSTLLNLPSWEELDRSQDIQVNLFTWFRDMTSHKPSDPDELKLLVVENAEMIKDSGPKNALGALALETGEMMAKHHSVATRFIVLTSSLAPLWIRSLRDTGHVTVLSIDPLKPQLVKAPWQPWLVETEGNPGRARMMHYIDQLAVLSSPTDQELIEML